MKRSSCAVAWLRPLPLFVVMGSLLLVSGVAPAAERTARPKLLVVLVVDQMRADYHQWYGESWNGGLRRLFDKGAWLVNARFPYLGTVTCPGHATVGTGTYPRTHGMIGNTWYDRQRQKVIECSDDPEAPLLGYGDARLAAGDSARNLMAPTLGDELQDQLAPRPRVVSFSAKARTAITMAGHKPDVAVWFESSTWVTSTAFTATRTPWLEAFVKANPIQVSVDKPWTKLLPETAYKFTDDGVGERPPSGWTTSFPHPIKRDASAPGIGRWAYTPFVDEYLGKLAQAAVSEMKLGQGDGVDVLAVGFSMTDLVGHGFGPRSHEVQDTLARLDVTIGKLLDQLDAQVGPDRYVVGFSADHGVAVIPEQAKAEGKDAGRIVASEVLKAADAAVAAELGPGGPFAVEIQSNDIYLAPGVAARLAAKPGAIKRVLAALRKVPGVAHALDTAGLARRQLPADPVRRAAALSFYPGRSGDLMIVPQRDWVAGSVGTNHGSMSDYDQHVPLLFYGAGIKPGRYTRPASPADLAPTLARLAGARMRKAEGRPIQEVIAVPDPTPRQARAPRRK